MKLQTRSARLLMPMLAAAAAAAALAGAGGCHEHSAPREVAGEVFRPEGEVRSSERFMETQAAIAARTNGTLRPYHFDGAMLNSLGEQKLDLMLKDDEAALPLVVYLDLPKDDALADRHDSIRSYLKDHGVVETQFRFVAGGNVNDVNPVAPALRTLRQIDAGAPAGGTPDAGSTAGK